jgi:hypothetical protein
MSQGDLMRRDVPTTRYFAVGFFTAAELEEKHRVLLARAQSKAPVPEIRSAVEAVTVTVFDVGTGTETVELGIDKVSIAVKDRIQGSGSSFAIERFDSNIFPGKLSPQEAFTKYLASAEGNANFGTATAVQLFAVTIDSVRDLAKS